MNKKKHSHIFGMIYEDSWDNFSAGGTTEIVFRRWATCKKCKKRIILEKIGDGQ